MDDDFGSGLLGALKVTQDVVRFEFHATAKEAAINERKQIDVTGTWMGFAPDGMGRVEYQGKIYECEVLSYTCRKKFSKVNLRRTRYANFVDWQ